MKGPVDGRPPFDLLTCLARLSIHTWTQYTLQWCVQLHTASQSFLHYSSYARMCILNMRCRRHMIVHAYSTVYGMWVVKMGVNFINIMFNRKTVYKLWWVCTLKQHHDILKQVRKNFSKGKHNLNTMLHKLQNNWKYSIAHKENELPTQMLWVTILGLTFVWAIHPPTNWQDGQNT